MSRFALSHRRSVVCHLRPALLLAVLVLTGAARADIFSVNSSADPGDGACTAKDVGDGCTLREAITAANASSNEPHTIGAGGPETIFLVSALPQITREITITSADSTVWKTISGSGAGSGADGLVISPGGYAHLEHMIITGFSGNGVRIIDESVLEMLNCQIDHCTLNGVLSNAASLGGGAVVAHDSSVSDCGGYGFALGGKRVHLSRSKMNGNLHLRDVRAASCRSPRHTNWSDFRRPSLPFPRDAGAASRARSRASTGP